MEQRGNENKRKHDEQIAHCAAACYKLINMTKRIVQVIYLTFRIYSCTHINIQTF